MRKRLFAAGQVFGVQCQKKYFQPNLRRLGMTDDGGSAVLEGLIDKFRRCCGAAVTSVTSTWALYTAISPRFRARQLVYLEVPEYLFPGNKMMMRL